MIFRHLKRSLNWHWRLAQNDVTLTIISLKLGKTKKVDKSNKRGQSKYMETSETEVWIDGGSSGEEDSQDENEIGLHDDDQANQVWALSHS